MSFRAARARSVRWRALDGHGLEHLTLHLGADGITALGVIIGEHGAEPYGVDYAIVLDRLWRTRELDFATTTGMALSLRSDGEGHWTNHDGRHLPEFDGVVDVDLAGSAFTNTLPIRRLDWGDTTGAVPLNMLFVPFDTFVPLLDGQTYTCLEPGRRFRHASEEPGYAVDLTVDSEGLILDYPGRFERV